MKKIECRGLSACYGKKSLFKNVNLLLKEGEFACLCGPNGSGKSTLLSILANLPQPNLSVGSAELYPALSEDEAGQVESQALGGAGAQGHVQEQAPVESQAHGRAGALGGTGARGASGAQAQLDLQAHGRVGARGHAEDFTLIRSLKRKEIAKVIAFLQQNEACVWDFSVIDYVLQGRFAYSSNGNYSEEDKIIAGEALALMGLSEFSDRTIHTLSGGEFQKVRIARALAQTPKFLLLDEPASALDFVYEPQLMSLLRKLAHEKGIGILASVHDVNLASEYVDKMNMLSADGIISGSPSQIMKPDILEKIYGVPFQCKEISSFQSSL